VWFPSCGGLKIAHSHCIDNSLYYLTSRDSSGSDSSSGVDSETLHCRARDANLQDITKKLMNADLHAAVLRVTQSRSPSLVGISGIVLQETKNAFLLVTSNNQLKSKHWSDIWAVVSVL